jgi:hypothetical protein
MVRRTLARKCYRVGRSATGLGLFATQPIAKGTVIVEYSGRRIPTRVAQAREAESGSRYMFEINSRWTVDGSSRRNFGRYANHSCRPNADSVLVKGKMVLRAIKAIAPDEEITYDYGRDYFDLFIGPKGCQCIKCRPARVRQRSSRKVKGGPARYGARGRHNRGGLNRTSAPSTRSRPGAKARRPQ